MALLTQAPKGTQDLLPRESAKWRTAEEVMRSEAAVHGFGEVRTPVFEHTELFLRSVGDTTDVVEKQMYTFEDEQEKKIEKEEGNLLIYRIREYVTEHPGEDLSLGRLARMFHINPSYLSRSFHQTIGQSLSQYIVQVRIETAKRLLAEGEMRIGEISRMVGFETPGYFTKVFSKTVGKTPKDYRINENLK